MLRTALTAPVPPVPPPPRPPLQELDLYSRQMRESVQQAMGAEDDATPSPSTSAPQAAPRVRLSPELAEALLQAPLQAIQQLAGVCCQAAMCVGSPQPRIQVKSSRVERREPRVCRHGSMVQAALRFTACAAVCALPCDLSLGVRRAHDARAGVHACMRRRHASRPLECRALPTCACMVAMAARACMMACACACRGGRDQLGRGAVHAGLRCAVPPRAAVLHARGPVWPLRRARWGP